MYKLLLVDDDKALLDKFYAFLDWGKYGFEVVAKLGDGIEVLEYIEKNHIDAIITDIRMPRMDGIELASRLFEAHPDIEIVFFSAFCDFEYTRRAIKYGVVDYISKPILHEDVEEVLLRLYDKLDKRTNRGTEDLINSEIAEARETLFCKILSSRILEIDSFKEELAEVEIPYQALCSKCTFVTFEILGMEKKLQEEWDNDIEKLRNDITTLICIDNMEHYTIRLDFSGNIVSVLYVSKDDGVTSLKYTQKIISDLWRMYKLISVNETFLEFNSLAEFKESLTAAKLDEMKALNGKVISQSDEQIFYEVDKYVDTHYCEDITIGMLAKEYHYSEKYFSSMFRKIKGKNFVDYLNEVRLEKAKAMLLQGEDIETVCRRVRFGTRRYFDKQFLSYTGETPAQYRKNQMERK